MNKLWVLAKNFNTYFIQRLIDEVGEVTCFNPWDEPPPAAAQGVVLVRSSGVYRSDLDLEVIEQHFSHCRVLNPLSILKTFRSKPRQYQALESLGLKILPWLDLQSATRQNLSEFIQLTGRQKFVLKPHRGQGGWGIRVLTGSETGPWLQQSSDREYLLQPYLEHAPEWRVFFHPDQPELCLRRKGTMAANFAQGGTAEVSRTPRELQHLVQELRSQGFAYGAVDALEWEGQFWPIDINATPGVEQLEAVTGQNIVRALVRSLRLLPK
jgi:glutathione synthase/RimK-type ligase-like ATP-grasp enzyme